jgi:ParB family transcriptional regulator, chromosome partitioning protein
MKNKIEFNRSEFIRVIDVNRIVKSDNIRKVFDENKLNELAKSIKQIGLLNPLTVRYDEKNDEYKILAGHRRFEACKKLRFEKIPCLLVDADVENDLRIMIDENTVRHDVSVIEEADFIVKQLRALDIRQNEFAKMIGKSESWVADRVAVNKYPPEMLRALKKGKISFSVAREFAKIDNHKVLKEYLEYAITAGCSPRMAREWVKYYNQDKNYTPVNKLFDEETEKKEYAEEEITTGCHICNEKFPLRACVHVNVCPECAKQIWEGGRP